jgi:hypothetical protein
MLRFKLQLVGSVFDFISAHLTNCPQAQVSLDTVTASLHQVRTFVRRQQTPRTCPKRIAGRLAHIGSIDITSYDIKQTAAQDTTLAMLNIEPHEPKNSGSNADDPINLAHLLGMLHIVDLIC